jgi:hypothetical protein
VTRQEVAALLATVAEAWPWARIEPAQAEIWHRSLDTIPADDAFPTMLDLVRDRTKPPSIAEFLAHKRSRAYWRKMNEPQPQLDVPESERGPADPDARIANGRRWLAECRARLADPRPVPAAGDEDRNQ